MRVTLLSVFCMVLLIGCSTINVKGNKMNMGDVNIMINDDYHLTSVNKFTDGTEKVDSYVYTYESSGKVSRIVIVEFKEIVKSNVTYWGNRKYQEPDGTYTYRSDYSHIFKSRDNILDYVTESIIERGYNIPECTLSRLQSYILDNQGKRKVDITYYEDVSDSKYPCDEWGSYTDLPMEQRKFVDGFVKRSDECFDKTK